MQERWDEDLYMTFSLYYQTAGSIIENTHGRIIAALKIEPGRKKTISQYACFNDLSNKLWRRNLKTTTSIQNHWMSREGLF
jgi:hypothetical protein